MSFQKVGVRWLTGVALLALLAVNPANADDGKPRFVAATGSDKGDCLNKFRPCRTLEYAIAKSGKADYVRVAEGSYTIANANALAALLSASGRIVGGYSKYSAYSEQNAAQKTLLIGVPPEFRDRFEQAGFSVIVDRKGIAADDAQQIRKLTNQVLASEKSHKAAACVANQSQGYACESIDLLSHVSLQDLRPTSLRGNDVWGFTDLNTGREYVLMGLQRGVAVVDISDPEAPEQVATASGTSTTWRDIKIYQHYDAAAKRWRAYAYVTADAVTDYLMVLDLSDLPNGIEQLNFTSDFTAAHNTYLINADYTFGIAQTTQAPRLGIAGGRENGGHHRLYSLAQPSAPSLLRASSAGYAHDLASFSLTQARKDTQCVNAQNEVACQVLADFNEDTVDIWDITNPAAPRSLASYSYPNAAYVHSGWWTEDGRYLFVHDELDESNFGLNTTVRVFDMNDLRSPQPAGSWVGPTRAIDHNGFVRGNRYYISNYSEGLTVLDITTPNAAQRVGYFDTFPTSSETGFVGAWGVYPFLESGTIAVADINTGLYLLENETLASANGTFAFVNASSLGIEGEGIDISVARTGGTSGSVSVQLELLHASTDASDASISSQTLSWVADDAAIKSTTLSLASDADTEDLELLLVRLKAPQGGATISYPDTARVYTSDASSTPRLRLLQSSISIDQARGKALVTVTRHDAASAETRVAYRTLPSATYNGFTASQGELIWAPNDAASKTVSVPLDPAALSAGQNGTFDVEFSAAQGAELQSQNGASATTLVANVVVTNASATAPPAPNPPQNPPPASGNGGGGGGGSMPWWMFGVALISVVYLKRRDRMVQT